VKKGQVKPFPECLQDKNAQIKAMMLVECIASEPLHLRDFVEPCEDGRIKKMKKYDEKRFLGVVMPELNVEPINAGDKVTIGMSPFQCIIKVASS
jgi:hypothetical protein